VDNPIGRCGSHQNHRHDRAERIALQGATKLEGMIIALCLDDYACRKCPINQRHDLVDARKVLDLESLTRSKFGHSRWTLAPARRAIHDERSKTHYRREMVSFGG